MTIVPVSAVHAGDLRQLEHWRAAIDRLGDMEAIAAPSAWQSLEHYTGQALRRALHDSVTALRQAAALLEMQHRSLVTATDAVQWRERLMGLRRAYFRTEAMIDFFADALATRASNRIATLLRACDHIATRSMAEVLAPLGRQVPSALTFLEKGPGAAILRGGVLLGDGLTPNPVAAIRVTRHNILRGTALIHEAGHQVASMLGWHEEVATALHGVSFRETRVSDVWAGWASEIVADAFALAHTGFASLLALRDVVDGDDRDVFQFIPGDPHPVPFLRVLLVGVALRRAFGPGPWDALVEEWRDMHPVRHASPDVQSLVRASEPHLASVAELMLWAPYRAFGGVALSQLIDPRRVSLAALEELRRASGHALYSSPYWLWNEAIRLLALTGVDGAGSIARMREALARQEAWMITLGALRAAA